MNASTPGCAPAPCSSPPRSRWPAARPRPPRRRCSTLPAGSAGRERRRARPLVDGVRRSGADRVTSTKRSRTTSTSPPRWRASRRRAQRAARAVEPVPEREPRRGRSAHPLTRSSAPTRCRRASRPNRAITASRSTRRTSSTCGASTARPPAPRARTCSPRNTRANRCRRIVAADVARTYFQLLAIDAQLAVLNETLATREQTVSLQRDRYQAGVIGEYDLAADRSRAAAVRGRYRRRRAAPPASSRLRSPRCSAARRARCTRRR